MDTRTRRASWDAATDAKPRKRHDFRHLKDGLYAAKQQPGFQTRIGIPELGAIDCVDSHAKASSHSSLYTINPQSPESVKILLICGLISSPVRDRNAPERR